MISAIKMYTYIILSQMTKKQAKNRLNKQSSFNYENVTQTTDVNQQKTFVIDLGDLAEDVTVLIKGKHFAVPVRVLPRTVNTNDQIEESTNKDTGTVVANGDENSQTNSGIISHSQFNDGGFGDIGQQWSRVQLKNANVINNHTSITLNVGDHSKVHLDHNSFGAGTTVAGKKNRTKKNKSH